MDKIDFAARSVLLLFPPTYPVPVDRRRCSDAGCVCAALLRHEQGRKK
ncbi:hypothetical protein [Streptomyces sp. NPDC048001]